MTRDEQTPEPPADVPRETRRWIDGQDARTLRQLVTYLEGRIEARQPGLEDLIEVDAAGDVRSVDVTNGYAHVRMHPPAGDGGSVNRDVISRYHVTREPRVEGEENLHWAYLGDIQSEKGVRCSECGRTYDADTDTCPHCGGTGFTADEDGGDEDV